MTAEPELIADRYALEERIGTGAVADVWRARDVRLDRPVALKLFRGEAADELGGAQDEVRTLARLDHPGLVTVYDTGIEPDGRTWVVMRLVDGEPLSALIRRGPLRPAQTAQYGTDVAAALAYVHRSGLVHRDVKPGNVLVSADGRAYLADFGIARIVDSPRRTMTGQLVGTPAYFSPEQVAGERVGPPTDVYALGLVLLECLTGHPEFPGTPMESAMARVNRDPQLPAGLPSAWSSLLTAMTARDPASRPGAAEVQRRLGRYLSGITDETAAMPAVAPPATAAEHTTVLAPVPTDAAVTARRRRAVRLGWLVVAIAVVLAAAIGGGVAYAVHQQSASVQNYVEPGSPTLDQQPLENDLQRLEQAVR